MFLLRIIVFLILLSLILILAYPLLIVFNIASGGDGFGLCNDFSNLRYSGVRRSKTSCLFDRYFLSSCFAVEANNEIYEYSSK